MSFDQQEATSYKGGGGIHLQPYIPSIQCSSINLIKKGPHPKELLNVLGEKQQISLPQVFIKGKYFGGADVIKQLHETGQLAKALKGVAVRSSGLWKVCDGCGDVRFVPCSNCNGRKKVFEEDEDELKRCGYCNENGLIRCPACCS